MITIYIVTDGASVHEFNIEADALAYIQTNPGATVTTEQRQIPPIDVELLIEQAYTGASWQLFLDLLESEGISHSLLTHNNPHIAMYAWNLYNTVLRLKNYTIYQRPLVPEYRTFMFLFNMLIYEMDTPKVKTALDILKQCSIELLNKDELVANLKTLNKLPSSYQY